MKILKTALAVGALLFTATSVHADDWDVRQNNYQVSKGDYHIQFRDYTNKDKRHLQLGTKLFDGRVKVQYQYWDNKGNLEHRPRFDVRIARLKTDYGNFSIGVRNEFRLNEGGDKFLRSWAQLGYQYKWGDNAIKIGLNPRFVYKKNGSKSGEWNDTLNTFSYSRTIGNWTISPGFWYQLDSDKNKKNLYSTLKLAYKF